MKSNGDMAHSPGFPKRVPLTFSVISASAEGQGKTGERREVFGTFNNECFVLSRGVEGLAHGDTASRLIVDTALWAYKLVRLRPFYWGDKTKFLKRIFRSSNLAVWQKRRETGFEDGLFGTLLVLMVGPKSFWIGTAGDSSAYLYRNHILKKLTNEDRNTKGVVTKALGFQRLGLVPAITIGHLDAHDVLLLTSVSIPHREEKHDVSDILSRTGTTPESLKDAAEEIVQWTRGGSRENGTVCIVKRIVSYGT
ncbi:MAG: hypothetical protein Q7S76_04400 [bacterium]|nr:hypothetical protein [bacterium]